MKFTSYCDCFNEMFPISLEHLNTWFSFGGYLGLGMIRGDDPDGRSMSLQGVGGL